MTRPAAEAARTAERVAALGFAPILAPLLEIGPRRMRQLPAVDAVLVTSGNALAALDLPGSTPLFAVGDSTAERARAAGFTEVASAGGDAADLAALVGERCPERARLLLATGLGQGGPLASALRAAGFRVHRRVAYAARPVRRLPAAASAALGAGHVHAALFLSAETAGIFVRLLPPRLRPALAEVDAIAIAQPAADRLALLPWRRVRVSLAPTLDQVLALL